MLLLDEGGTAHELTGDGTSVDAADLADATGWVLKPEGLCKGEVCVPLLGRTITPSDGRIDLVAWAEALRLPLALDVEEGVAAVVPAPDDAPVSGGAAPELVLPDVDGNEVSFGRFLGRKRLLLAWASW
jgi:hypothetical protein